MSHITETAELPPIDYVVPETFAQCAGEGSSALGMSSTSSWLSCPEYSHLRSLGVRQKPSYYEDAKLSAANFGILFHALRAIRFVHGMERAESTLRKFWESKELSVEDAQKALLILRVYDQKFPREADTFDLLGVECTVYTNIHDWWGRPLYRSVRYDTVVKMKADGAVFSLECKTASRGGQSTLNPYIPQGMTHSAIWNANKQLVDKYGEMQGTIWDHAVKTVTPDCDRVGPRYFTKPQQARALDYLRLPDVIQMPKLPDGSYPKFFHNCWGKYSPCSYISLCHEDAHGDYEVVDRETGEKTEYLGAA